MKKIKSTTKTILSKLLSLSLAAVIVFAGISATAVSARAAVVTVPTISAGEQWSGSWSDQVEYNTIKLEVEETSFYTITITDHKKTGNIELNILDKESGFYSFYEYIESDSLATDTFTTQVFYLVAGHKYELLCGYFVDEYNLSADVTITLNKSDFEPAELPNCEAANSDLMVQFEGNDEWFQFKTGAAGDYSLNYSPYYMDMGVSVYSPETGEAIYWNYTEKYDEWTEEYVYCQLVFNLEANTTYYFAVYGYDTGDSCRLSMTKCAKNLKTIEINEPLYTFSSMWEPYEISYDCFNYKLTYTDNSTEYVNYVNIWEKGYELPYIEYVGEELELNYNTKINAGRQPVEVTYNGNTTTAYIEVQSLVDRLSDLDAVVEDERCSIEYESGEEYTYYWRIKVSENGYYGMWRNNSDDFGTNFEYYSYKLIDENNDILERNDDGCWELYANKDYALCFTYCYDQNHSYNDIVFWFQKDADLFTGWKKIDNKWYFYENGNIVKSAWRKDSKGWVYLGSDGAMKTNAWVKDSKGWCYVGSNGYAVTNQWKKDSKGWIYLDSNGSMTKSKWVKDGGKWYYCDANGYMVTNKWSKDSKGWVYVGADGAMVTNKWVKDSKGWCYVGSNGYAVTNCWKKDSKGWIYLDANGSMTKSKWVKSSGKWYYCDANGYMVANKSLKIGSKTYKFNASGVCTNP